MNKKSFSFVCFLTIVLISLCFFTSCDADQMKKFGEEGASLSSNVVNSRGNTQAVEETESTIKSSIELYTSDSSLTTSEEGTLSENASKIATLINKAASTDSGKASIIASLQKESDMDADVYDEKIADAIGSFFSGSGIVESIQEVLGNATEVSEMIDDLLEILEAPEEITELVGDVEIVLNAIIENTDGSLGEIVAGTLGLLAEDSADKASYGNVATLMIIQGVASTVDEINFSELSTVSDYTALINPILPALGAIDLASGTQFKEFLGLVMEILPEVIS